MQLKFITFVISMFLISTSINSQSKIVLATDFDGKVVKGNKQALIDEIRKGKSVRVGWQLDFNEDKKADFDHWADAEFITVINGEVFTQIRNINYQIANLDVPQIDIVPNNTMWTGILGTNSILKNRFVYNELEYEVDDKGKPILTPELENEIKNREIKTWNVATFWVID